jgi:signal transduction histidine kinase
VKSNLITLFIFLISLFISLGTSYQLDQDKKYQQQQTLKDESKTIAHNIQNQLQNDAEKILLTIQHWHSIEDINQYGQTDIEKLKIINPFIKDVKLFPLIDYKQFSLAKDYLIRYELDIDKKRELRERNHLPLTYEQLNETLIYTSRVNDLYIHKKTFYLQFPIVIEKNIIAYLDVSIDLSKLLKNKIDTQQIKSPFLLSDNGSILFSSLPKNIRINDVTENIDLPIYGRDWSLMVWSNNSLVSNYAFLYYSLLISLSTAFFVKLLISNFSIRQQLINSKNDLSRVNKQFKNNQAKLIQSNKLVSLGEMASGIAHEINQPLQVICIHAEMFQENLRMKNYAAIEENIPTLLNQVDRIEKIIKQVSSFGRDGELQHYQAENTKDIFDNVIGIIQNQYQQEKIELRQIIPPSLPNLYCNKIQIEQVLINLLINAKDAVEKEDEKMVFIKAHIQDKKLYIQISDTGCGITASQIDKIFTPFYTTKTVGKGTGLGLSISYSIILRHGGELKVSSELGKGSIFTIILPLNKAVN